MVLLLIVRELISVLFLHLECILLFCYLSNHLLLFALQLTLSYLLLERVEAWSYSVIAFFHMLDLFLYLLIIKILSIQDQFLLLLYYWLVLLKDLVKGPLSSRHLLVNL